MRYVLLALALVACESDYGAGCSDGEGDGVYDGCVAAEWCDAYDPDYVIDDGSDYWRGYAECYGAMYHQGFLACYESSRCD